MRNLFVAVLLVISLMVVSCGKAPASSDIIGKWKDTQINRTLEFRQDGTVTMEDRGVTVDGKYKLVGQNMEVEFPSPVAVESGPANIKFAWKVSLSGQNLVIVMGEGRNTEAFTFEKVK